MLALVLSGGGNFGAMQAGALETLLETGFRPEMIVGTSAGGLNAIHIAYDPTPEGARQITTLWGAVSSKEIGTRNLVLTRGIQGIVARRDGLLPSAPLVTFLEQHLPPGIETFGQLTAVNGIRALATAVSIETSQLRAFGDQSSDRLIDGAMATSALPPWLPPWTVGGERYLDGGIYTKLPLWTAIERGATQIIALNVIEPAQPKDPRGMLAISAHSITLMLERQVSQEIRRTRATGIPLRVIDLRTPHEVAFWDFRRAEYLAQKGREIARQELEREPLRIYPRWRRRICRALAEMKNPEVRTR